MDGWWRGWGWGGRTYAEAMAGGRGKAVQDYLWKEGRWEGTKRNNVERRGGNP